MQIPSRDLVRLFFLYILSLQLLSQFAFGAGDGTPPRTTTKRGPLTEVCPPSAPRQRRSFPPKEGVPIVDPAEITNQKILGKGANGQVFSCELRGVPCAIKVLQSQSLRDAQAETQRQKRAGDAGVAPKVIEGPFYIDRNLGFAMEYEPRAMTFEDASEHISGFEDLELRQSLFQKLFHETFLKLSAIHETGIFHRDISPANILVIPSKPHFIRSEDIESVRIIDFGVESDELHHSQYHSDVTFSSQKTADLTALALVFLQACGEYDYTTYSGLGSPITNTEVISLIESSTFFTPETRDGFLTQLKDIAPVI